MPRSKQQRVFPGAPPVLAALLFLLVAPALPAQTRYHLQLEARPAAAFPYLSRFGTVDLDVYSGGVHADTVWLDGFSRNGSPTITVMNPLGRMYTEVPVQQIGSILRKLGAAGGVEAAAAPVSVVNAKGTVAGMAATRHRLVYGPSAYIDVWTADAIGENPQVRVIVQQLLSAISPGTARVANGIRGTPVHVELNFRRFQKVALVRAKKLTFDNEGEKDALETGAIYFRAPLLDALWK